MGKYMSINILLGVHFLEKFCSFYFYVNVNTAIFSKKIFPEIFQASVPSRQLPVQSKQ